MAVFRLGSALVQLGMAWLYLVHRRCWCGSAFCGLLLNGSALVQLWFSCGLHDVPWYSCGLVVVQFWLLFDVCCSVWFSCGLAWCGSVLLRFSLGAAWHGLVIYGSV